LVQSPGGHPTKEGPRRFRRERPSPSS
jgi:hypothetical protein